MRNGLLRISSVVAACAVCLSLGQASGTQLPEPASAAVPATSRATPVPVPDTRRLPPKSPLDRYELGPGDLVRIRFYERDDLSGDFRVRPDRRIGLPMLGIFYVSGKDADELEQEVATAYIAATGRKPQVLVEVIERRPFYVAGMVNKPGPYPFVPHMSVLHALTIAGGVLRTPVADTSVGQLVSVNREIGRLRQTEAGLKRLIVRLTRLQAERDGLATAVPPQALLAMGSPAEANALMSGEVRLMQQRAEALGTRKKRFAESIIHIREEIRELEGQMRQTQEQVRLNNLQLNDLNELREKGLSRRPQTLQLQTLIAGYEGRTLEISAAIARAKRALEESEQSMISLDLDQKVLIEQDIVETERQVAATELEIDATRRLIEQMTGIPVDLATAGPDVELVYTIVRYDDDRYLYIDADETMAMRPGDTLRVNLKASGAGQATMARRNESRPSEVRPNH